MKKVATYIVLASSLLGFGACNQSNSSGTSGADSTGTAAASDVQLNQLTNDPNAAAIRLYFTTKELSQTDSSIIYEARSLYKEDTVGLKVEVMKVIDAGIATDGTPDEDLGFKQGSFKFSSMGPATFKLLNALNELYKLNVGGPVSDKEIVPLTFSSNKEKVELSKSTSYNFKFFFNQAAGDAAEYFGVLDTYKKSFELTEKDSTNRAGFLHALTGK